MNSLKTLSEASNNLTRSRAFQLLHAVRSPIFIICLSVIAGYSVQLEPFTNQLQQQDLDLQSSLKHIKYLKEKVQVHRENTIQEFSSIFELAQLDADELDVELTCPRLAKRSKHRTNTPTDTPEDYFRRTDCAIS